jgi:uncharacterized membrane protein
MRWLGLLAVAVLALYPFVIYFGLQRFEPRWLGVVFAAVYLLRLVFVVKRWWQRIVLLGLLLVSALVLWWVNSEVLLKLLPCMINLGLASYFGYTLYRPPSLPTRIALLEYNGDLPVPVQRYTLAITRLWCGFFIFNAAAAGVTALFFSRDVWAFYNGFIAYLLTGGLFALEYSYRILVFHKKHAL